MIPPPEQIELYYEGDERRLITQAGENLNSIPDDRVRTQLTREFIHTLWPDELERIEKTTYITTKAATVSLLKLNYAQRQFWNDVVVRCRAERNPVRGIILKARQLGFSTLIQALQRTWCNEHAHRNSLTVSYDDDSTEELFGKVQFMEDMAWAPRKTKRSRMKTCHYAEPHGSIFWAITAGNENVARGRTVHHCHMSELPMWPDPETSVVSLNQAIPSTPMSTTFIESTARGMVGLFYEQWEAAVAGETDYRPFFAPWQWDPEYRLPFQAEDHLKRFMKQLLPKEREYAHRHRLEPEQMNWRAWTIRNKLNGDVRLFMQEYPASPEEAFLTTGSPVFDQEKVMALSHNCVPPLWRGEIMLEVE